MCILSYMSQVNWVDFDIRGLRLKEKDSSIFKQLGYWIKKLSLEKMKLHHSCYISKLNMCVNKLLIDIQSKLNEIEKLDFSDPKVSRTKIKFVFLFRGSLIWIRVREIFSNMPRKVISYIICIKRWPKISPRKVSSINCFAVFACERYVYRG